MNTIRVASFNLENFLGPDLLFAGRPADAPFTRERYELKKKWIDAILDEARPDIVGFQEVFSFAALKDALNGSRYLEGCEAVAPGIADGENIRARADGRLEASGPHLALASRLPVLGSERITDFPAPAIVTLPGQDPAAAALRLGVTRFERPILKARIALRPDLPATVLVAHLKSKRPKFLDGEDHDDPLVKAVAQIRSLVVRSAEAVALRAIVVGLLKSPGGAPGEPLILLGDLNDDVPAVTTQVIAGERSPPFAREERKRAERDVALYSAHDIEDERSLRNVSYTHVFNGRHELLDHIFVSQELIRQYPKRVGYVTGTRILNDHVLDERWNEPTGGGGRRGPSLRSDHGIPVTEIRLEAPALPSA